MENPCRNCALSRSEAPSTGLGSKVSGLLSLLGALFGGWIGWWLGDFVGLMTAFFLSTIASGVGLYAGRRLAQWMVE